MSWPAHAHAGVNQVLKGRTDTQPGLKGQAGHLASGQVGPDPSVIPGPSGLE
eukprot:NODE_1564_length_1371_cov_11.590015_g1300_i0.p10 GENE.NODE_1564_length_1371_cov_11.590015_g1300_i0~~NODE_1564_length_1371_cov_11.590015_g1300_i0.p10  ORF type:complete len:52 (-),score=3.12 NODE_1564_length_1371_cov_11.590015_g1300_i0:286-441(-)